MFPVPLHVLHRSKGHRKHHFRAQHQGALEYSMLSLQSSFENFISTSGSTFAGCHQINNLCFQKDSWKQKSSHWGKNHDAKAVINTLCCTCTVHHMFHGGRTARTPHPGTTPVYRPKAKPHWMIWQNQVTAKKKPRRNTKLSPPQFPHPRKLNLGYEKGLINRSQ